MNNRLRFFELQDRDQSLSQKKDTHDAEADTDSENSDPIPVNNMYTSIHNHQNEDEQFKLAIQLSLQQATAATTTATTAKNLDEIEDNDDDNHSSISFDMSQPITRHFARLQYDNGDDDDDDTAIVISDHSDSENFTKIPIPSSIPMITAIRRSNPYNTDFSSLSVSQSSPPPPQSSSNNEYNPTILRPYTRSPPPPIRHTDMFTTPSNRQNFVRKSDYFSPIINDSITTVTTPPITNEDHSERALASWETPADRFKKNPETTNLTQRSISPTILPDEKMPKIRSKFISESGNIWFPPIVEYRLPAKDKMCPFFKRWCIQNGYHSFIPIIETNIGSTISQSLHHEYEKYRLNLHLQRQRFGRIM